VLADNHFKAIDRRVGIILLVSGTWKEKYERIKCC
jgi:hypothetical protein